MKQALPFFEALLDQARRYQQSGHADSVRLLRQLLSFPSLPVALAAEANTRLGEWFLKRRHHAKARRHLRAALALTPADARLHHRLGLCLANDPNGKPELAYRHYRRALQLDPAKRGWRGEAGLLAIRLGRTEAGLAFLRSAYEQDSDDTAALTRLVKGLCQTGQPEEALRLVRLARFRTPRCDRLLRMEADLLLARLRKQQEEKTARTRKAEGPVLLPFVVPQPVEDVAGVRQDRAHTLPGPHLVRLPARAGRWTS